MEAPESFNKLTRAPPVGKRTDQAKPSFHLLGSVFPLVDGTKPTVQTRDPKGGGACHEARASIHVAGVSPSNSRGGRRNTSPGDFKIVFHSAISL